MKPRSATKKGEVLYREKKMVGSKWQPRYLVMSTNPESGRREVSMYSDKTTYFTKKEALIARSTVRQCEATKSGHSGSAAGFRVITEKKKKYEFSVSSTAARSEWMEFGNGADRKVAESEQGNGSALTADGLAADDGVARSSTLRDYQRDGGDLGFERDLELYLQQNRFSAAKEEGIRKMERSILKKVIAEWRDSEQTAVRFALFLPFPCSLCAHCLLRICGPQ